MRFATALLFVLLLPPPVYAQNFTSSDGKAVEVAERARRYSALFWSGKELPGRWSRACPIQVTRANDASGLTSFVYDRGQVYGWNMRVSGRGDDIYDTVIPHEVDHAVRACLVGRPMARWLDEGCAQIMEGPAQHVQFRQAAMQGLDRGTVFHYFDATEYPQDGKILAEVYGGGFSLVEYLLLKNSRKRLIEFSADPRKPSAKIEDYYGVSAGELRVEYERWFRRCAQNGMGCKAFGCCRHEVARPPVIQAEQSPEQVEARRAVVIFTMHHCEPCKMLEEDIAKGEFGKYTERPLYVKYGTKEWQEAERAFTRRTGKRIESTPTIWVSGTERYAVEYKRGRSGGIIQGLFRLAFGTPNCAQPRVRLEPYPMPEPVPPVPPDPFPVPDPVPDPVQPEVPPGPPPFPVPEPVPNPMPSPDLSAIFRRLDKVENDVRRLAQGAASLTESVQQVNANLGLLEELIASMPVRSDVSALEQRLTELAGRVDALSDVPTSAQIVAINAHLTQLDESIKRLAAVDPGANLKPYDAKLRELEIKLQRNAGDTEAQKKEIALLLKKIDEVLASMREASIASQRQSSRIDAIERDVSLIHKDVKLTNERLSGKLRINVKVDEEKDVQLKEP